MFEIGDILKHPLGTGDQWLVIEVFLDPRPRYDVKCIYSQMGHLNVVCKKERMEGYKLFKKKNNGHPLTKIFK